MKTLSSYIAEAKNVIPSKLVMKKNYDSYLQKGKEGEGYIRDKEGNEYPVKAMSWVKDTGRITGGTEKFELKIFFPGVKYKGKDAYYEIEGFWSINGHKDEDIIKYMQAGMYLEDYLARYGVHVQYYIDENFLKEIASKGDKNAQPIKPIKR